MHSFYLKTTAVLLLSAFFFAAVSLYAWERYLDESDRLRQLAYEVIGMAPSSPTDTLQRLNTWVFHNRGFAKNRHYFLIQKFGPTPVQVLEYGGDCADKSRLLSAMLYHVGIPNTLVMLYSPDYGRPTHTVVETRAQDLRAVADPVFDIVFPDGRGGMLGVTTLREHHDVFLARIAQLAAERGPQSKVAHYDTELESYRWPKTVNWERSPLTRGIAAMLAPLVPEPSLVQRPRVLEEPVLLVSAATLAAAVVLLSIGVWTMRQGLLRLRHVE